MSSKAKTKCSKNSDNIINRCKFPFGYKQQFIRDYTQPEVYLLVDMRFRIAYLNLAARHGSKFIKLYR